MTTTPTTNPEFSDRTIELVDAALTHFQHHANENDAENEIWKIINFITNIAIDQNNGTDLFLEYVSEDPIKGREILEKLGTDATFGDLDEAIKNGTITQ